MNPLDDHRLLARAAIGDQSAIDALVSRHARLVLAACQRQLPSADADDAAQAVFLVLWRRAAQAAAAPSLPGWLVVTARLVCANSRRTVARRRQAERAAGGPERSEPIVSEAQALLDQAIAALPSAERAAVVQRHLIGDDVATAAAALGCAEGTVHSRTSRGLERMRAWFARRGIACSVVALTGMCAEACSASESITSSRVAACVPASSAAQALAATSTPTITVSGVIIMTVTALASTVLVLLAATVVFAAEPYIKVYGMDDLAGSGGIVIVRLGVSAGDPQTPEPNSVVALADSCGDLQSLAATVLERAGDRAHVGFVDVGMSDRELIRISGQASDVELALIRQVMARDSDVALPGFDMRRTLLVRGDDKTHRVIDTDLGAVRHHVTERLHADGDLMAAAEALSEAARLAFGHDWPSANGPGGDDWPMDWKPKALTANQPLPQMVGLAARRFAVIWLPEGLHNSRPVAVATDGQGSLVAMMGDVRWYPNISPAIIALGLRQQLDRQEIHAPLHRDHWSHAAGLAVPGSESLVKLQDDLTSLISASLGESGAGQSGF